MEGRSAVWLLAALMLLLTLISAEEKNSPKYFEVGGKLVLHPKPVSEPITSISWKFDGSIVGEWNKVTLPLVFAPAYEGRADVDTTTGVLEIRNMMKTDDGSYTVEINERVQSGGYDVEVIKRVPKPDAVMGPLTCSQSSKSCSLSCRGEIKEAGPVTFYFKKGDGDWEEGEQDIEIMNDATTQAIEKFFCRMKNPLGQEDSELVDNLFYLKSNAGVIAGSIAGVLIVLVAAVVGGVLLYRKKPKNQDITDPETGPSSKENGNKSERIPLGDGSPDSQNPAPEEAVRSCDLP